MFISPLSQSDVLIFVEHFPPVKGEPELTDP